MVIFTPLSIRRTRPAFRRRSVVRARHIVGQTEKPIRRNFQQLAELDNIIKWRFTESMTDNGATYTRIVDYYFNNDGTFKYEDAFIGSEVFTGKYAASGGKIKFTGVTSQIIGVNGAVPGTNARPDVTVEYQYNSGESLTIGFIGDDDSARMSPELFYGRP